MSVIRLTSFFQRIHSSLFQSVFPHASYQSVLKIHTKDGQSNINTSEKLSQGTLDLLVCPLTKKKLRYDEERQLLINDELNIGYNVNDGIPNLVPTDAEEVVYTYCPHCKLCWQENAASKTSPLYLGNIKVILDFLNSEEEATAIKEIDQIPWMPSQSGRKKQDFGPKVNFKKKKSKVGNFKGFPNFSKRFIDRFQQLRELSDFSPVELCHLDYSPDRGSAIEPHIDDFWIWGERLVTINLASQTVLTLTPANTKNCDCFCTSQLLSFTEKCYHQTSGILSKKTDIGRLPSSCNQNFDLEPVQCVCALHRTVESNVTPRVNVLLPPRSLIVLAGCARYNWFHAIKRDDIASRRLAMTFRELSSDFLVNENEKELGKELIDIGKRFCDFNVHF